jgi:peptidoglycan/LPS O-acetylase OafA/YrhL
VVYAAIFFTVYRVPLSGFAADYILAVFTFTLLWILLSARENSVPESASTRISSELAGFSYTLYVVHMPFLLLLTAACAGEQRWQGTAQNVSKALGILFLSIVYAYVVAWLTESRTGTLRRWLERH